MILGLLAIPFVTVSGVALFADVASTTDPAAATIGIPAALGGVLVGGLIFHVALVMHSGAVALRGALLATVERRVAEVTDRAIRRVSRAAIRPRVGPRSRLGRSARSSALLAVDDCARGTAPLRLTTPRSEETLMRSRAFWRLLAAFFVFTLLAAACGDDDDHRPRVGRQRHRRRRRRHGRRRRP